jgi:hypothetical protein
MAAGKGRRAMIFRMQLQEDARVHPGASAAPICGWNPAC